METDVVRHTVLLSEASEQQAGHAHPQMTSQKSQCQVVGMSMGQ